MALLRECTETETEDLLKILIEVKRTDVLDDMLKFINVESGQLAPMGNKLPTQESLESESSCRMSWPLQDSGNAR